MGTLASEMPLPLGENEARLRLLLGSVAQAVWEADAGGVVVKDSPSWRAYTGQTVDEWLGYGWLDAIHPEDRSFSERQWREAIAAGRIVDTEFRLRGPDGGWRWTNVRATPVLDGNGQIASWAGLNIDIDARRRAEDALQESARRHEFLLALNDVLRPLADPTDIQTAAMQALGRHLNASRVAYTQIAADEYIIERDYTADVPSMAGRYPIASFGPNKTAAYREGVTRVIVDAELDTFNDPAAVANFAALGVRAGIGVPLFKNGRMVATLVVHQREPRNWTAHDVAVAEETAERTWAALERARAEASLRRSEEKYRTLFENLGQGYAECELIRDGSGRAVNFRYIALNPAFERLTGFKVAEMLGRTARDAVPDLPSSHFDMYEQIVESGSPTRREYKIDPLDRWYENHIYPGVGDRFFALYEDITERKHAERALNESERRLKTLVQGVPQLVWRAIDGGKWTWASPQWTDYTGQAEQDSRGDGWLEPVHPFDRERILRIWREAAEGGEFHADYRVRHAEDGCYRWFQTRATPVRDNAGAIVEWLGTSTDVDDLRRLQERQQVLLAELQHRVRNILAVTRSIISRSDDGERSTQDYVAHLQGRIAALARTQVLLTRTAGTEVDLEMLIRDEILSQAGSENQFVLNGEAVAVSPKCAEVLTLAIHELATNATKYGAFSRPSGRLTVNWSTEVREGANWLVIVWREHGVPIVGAVPRRYGFESELISRRIPYELKGHGRIDLKPGGLESRIEFPLVDGESILQTDAGGR